MITIFLCGLVCVLLGYMTMGWFITSQVVLKMDETYKESFKVKYHFHFNPFKPVKNLGSKRKVYFGYYKILHVNSYSLLEQVAGLDNTPE